MLLLVPVQVQVLVQVGWSQCTAGRGWVLGFKGVSIAWGFKGETCYQRHQAMVMVVLLVMVMVSTFQQNHPKKVSSVQT